MKGILDHQLVFVAGKGGVGKTTITAALAALGAQAGKRTLAVEVDGKGDLAQMFGLESEVGFEPVKARDNLWLMTMDTEKALAEYLKLFVKVPFATRMPGLGKIFDFVSTAAPGVKEILVIGKLCYEAKNQTYDFIVVDPPASGHTVSQLGVTSGVGELIELGLVKNQTQWMLDILSNPERSTVVLVATPEETPVEEALELACRIRKETPVALGGAVLNRIVQSPFGSMELAALKLLEESSHERPGLDKVFHATELYVALAARHERNKHVFERRLDGIAVAAVDEFFGVLSGSELLPEVIESLEVSLF
jgi:anion-transporting  ArsA/GET3 family ATPase